MDLSYNVDDEYKILIDKLNKIGHTKDIMKADRETSPYTYGLNTDENCEMKFDNGVLYNKEDINCKQTLDYIFEITVDRDNLIRRNSMKNLNTCSKDISLNVNNQMSNRELAISSNRDAVLQISEKKNSYLQIGRNSNSSKMNNSMSNCDQSHQHKGKRKLNVDSKSSRVEYFLVSEKPYQQLSDHFGLSVDIVYQ
jgi:hypothetical protein